MIKYNEFISKLKISLKKKNKHQPRKPSKV